jgi:ribonuclease P/MRP protein subunit POP3
VKQLRTTAPKDMKMAKLVRAEGKAAAKARNKSKAKISKAVVRTS